MANLELQAQVADNLDSEYYAPRTVSDAAGNFVLGPMRDGYYSIYMYAKKGQIMTRSDPAPAKVSLKDGDRFDLGELKYEGDEPAAATNDYQREYARTGPANPTTQPDSPGWKRVDVAMRAGTALK